MLKTILINWIINFALSKLFGGKPDTTDSQLDGSQTDIQAESLRIWLLEKADSFKLLAEKTNITIDDKIIAWLVKVLNNAALFGLLYNALNGITEPEPAQDEPANAGLIRRLRRRHWINDEQAETTVAQATPILQAIKAIRGESA